MLNGTLIRHILNGTRGTSVVWLIKFDDQQIPFEIVVRQKSFNGAYQLQLHLQIRSTLLIVVRITYSTSIYFFILNNLEFGYLIKL